MLQAFVTSHKVSQAAQDICKCHKSKNATSHAIGIAWEIETAGDIFSSHRRLRKWGDSNENKRLYLFLVKVLYHYSLEPFDSNKWKTETDSNCVLIIGRTQC